MAAQGLSEILSYSPRRKRGFLRRNRRWIILLMIVGVVGLGYLKYDAWGRPVWNRLSLLYYQRQCMSYSAPPTQVIFEEDRAQIAKLSTMPGSMPFWEPGAAPCRSAFERAFPYRDYSPGGTVFLHERRTPGGISRLVMLDLVADLRDASFFLYFRGDLVTAGTLFSPPAMTTTEFTGAVFPPFPSHSYTQWPPLRLMAGQIDPDDPARFTVECQTGAQFGTIDGWLEDTPSGPALHLHYRDAQSMSRSHLLEYYARCAAFEPSQTTGYWPIACSTDAGDIDKVSAFVDDYELDPRYGPARLYYAPRLWREIGLNDQPRTVFLHELSTAAGERRLVHVAPLYEEQDESHRGIGGFFVSIIPPPTSNSPVVTDPSSADTTERRSVHIPALLEADWLGVGQIAPRSPDRFSLGYRNNNQSSDGREHFIQCRLLGDAKRVEFRMEDGSVLTALGNNRLLGIAFHPAHAFFPSRGSGIVLSPASLAET